MVWAPHVTVASIVERSGRFLVVEEGSEGQRVYNQPAGHLEPGETLLEAVIRETREETGLCFQPSHLVGIYRWPLPGVDRTYLRFCFAGSATDSTQPLSLDPAIHQTLWLTRTELVALRTRLRSPLVLCCIDDYLRGPPYALELLHDLG